MKAETSVVKGEMFVVKGDTSVVKGEHFCSERGGKRPVFQEENVCR